ncbi:MAG: hypothetical protein M1829_001438 [Trizodia sp. TS-e1964]|nr:MAG: hypothetical protein M1829_001438 [Trizodia sp. TS-e1964]
MNAHVSAHSGLEAAKHWVSQHAGPLHPALAPSIQLGDQRAVLKPRPKQSDGPLRTHTDQFLKVMEIYMKTATDKELAKSRLKSSYTWDEVIWQAKKAEETYKNAATGVGGLVRKAGRVSGDYSNSVTPFLKLLPDNEYTSILCGGITLMFEVAKRMSDKRKEILDALEGIPLTIQTAEHCCEDFPEDEPLHDATTDLYLAILTAIEGMMKWLVDKAGWKQIKAIIGGPNGTKKLDEKIKDLQDKLQALRNRVDLLCQRAISRTDNSVGRMEPILNDVGQTTRGIKNDTTRTYLSVTNIRGGVEHLGTAMDSMNTSVSSITENTNSIKISQDEQAQLIQTGFAKMQLEVVDAKNGLVSVLQEQFRLAEWNQKKLDEAQNKIRNLEVELERARTPINMPKAFVTRDELINLLDADPDMAAKDVQTSIRRGQALDESHQGRAGWLMRNSTFQAWLTSGGTQVLLVDGNASDAAFERTSSMSLLCAMLVNSLGEVQPAIPIQFFCGLHTASNDSLSGPRGLIRSLVTQLLCIYDFDLTFVDSYQYLDHLQSHEVDHLCDLFRQLVKQLPTGLVLFCVIDGISLYENWEWRAETCFVIRKLRELSEDPHLQALLKLLVTSPLASRLVKDHISIEDHLILPRDAGAERQILTERLMTVEAQRPVRERETSYKSTSSFDNFDEGYDEVDFDEGNVADDDDE